MAKGKKKAVGEKPPAPPPADPLPMPATPKGPVFGDTATSPDGRRIARVEQTNDFHGMFHEDMSWFIEVTEGGERIYGTGRDFSGYVDDTDDHRASGVRVSGVAFDEAGRLVIRTSEGNETIVLPPALHVKAKRVRESCASALKAAYPERWQILADGVETLLWPAARACSICSPGGPSGTCHDCRALLKRRAKMEAPPDPAMVVAETSRALREQGNDDALDVVATLEAQAARVQSDTACSMCGKTVRSLADLRTPAGRVCAACVASVGQQKPA